VRFKCYFGVGFNAVKQGGNSRKRIGEGLVRVRSGIK
jgi:hypothetical protein